MPHVPWPLPAALGLLLGIAAHAAGGAWTLVACLLAPLVLGAAALALRHGPERRRALWIGWLALPLLIPLGVTRHAQREARPAPLAAAAGRTLELTGRSDGRFLRLSGGAGRVALAPSGRVPRGWVRVRGEARAPGGRRNPGDFAYDRWLRRRDVHVQLLVDEVLASRSPNVVRARLARGVRYGLEADAATLMSAMTLGRREGAGALRERFARAGLAHLLALSGLHVGVLVAVAAGLLRPLGPLRAPLLALALAGFVALVGPTPSVIRAALMTLAGLATAAVGVGRLQPGTALGLAAVLTLAWRPDWAFDTGFQLSYAALAGLLAFAAPFADRWRPSSGGAGAWFRAYLVGAAGASLAASLGTLSLVADAFGRVPVLGPLVNVPALPLASALVPLGFAAGLLGAVAPPLAALPNALVAPLARALLALAEAGAGWPAAPWSEVGVLGHAYFALGAAPWACVLRGLLAPWRALLLTALALAGCLAAAPTANPAPELLVLDVGQGDATLLRLPGRVEVLVDGGGTPFSDFDVGAGTVLPALRARGVDELELVVATHADADHMEGLVTVLRKMPVGTLAYGREAPDRAVWSELRRAARARGVRLLPVRRGHRLRLGEAELRVLHPAPAGPHTGNDASVAFTVWWRGRPWASLLGDVSREVEAELAVPPAPVLMAPHHGSGDSTGAALLRAASPDTVLISVGRNAYGHPSEAVLERAEAHGARVRRTDREGALRLRPAW